MIYENTRMMQKRTDVTGVIPTINSTSPNTITNDWSETDILIGEFFINTTDKRIWFRTESEIVEITGAGTPPPGLNLGDLLDVDLTGLVSDDTVIVYDKLNDKWVIKAFEDLRNEILSGFKYSDLADISFDDNENDDVIIKWDGFGKTWTFVTYQDFLANIDSALNSTYEITLYFDGNTEFTYVPNRKVKLTAIDNTQNSLIYTMTVNGNPYVLNGDINKYSKFKFEVDGDGIIILSFQWA